MPLFGRRGARLDDGRATAFDVAALAYLDSLYGSALRLTRNADDAQDLVQETFLKALRGADRFEPGTNLKAWLFTILHNTWRNQVRDRGRSLVDVNSEAVERAVDVGGTIDSPERALERQSMDVGLRDALDALPAAFREAVWLRDVEEFTYAEIARMLDVPIGTVMSRISRGRRQLHDRLTKPIERAESAERPTGPRR